VAENFTIRYQGLANGTYPPVTDRPLIEWLTLREALESDKPVVIDAIAEHFARTGRNCSLDEGVDWQEYFEWLAGIEGGVTLPWNELRVVMERNILSILQLGPATVGAREPACPRPQAESGEMLEATPDYHSSGKGTMKRKELPPGIDKKQSPKKESYRSIVRRLVPSPPLPPERSFNELYVTPD
jgi:hypothetical protein